MPTALLGAVLLLSLLGAGYKVYARMQEKQRLSALQASLGNAPAIVKIGLAVTPAPANAALPAPTAPSPSPDPLLIMMQPRMDNLRALQADNGDLYGWITIPDTRIDYPVMYAPDQKWYYLDHDFEGNSSKSGLPFLDEASDPDARRMNLLIYGHNMKDGSMFAGLHKFADADYYAAHRTLYFLTPDSAMEYAIVAVANVSIEEDTACPFYRYANIADAAALREYLHIIKEASLYPDDLDAENGGEFLTLCTCVRGEKTRRLIVIAKRGA